MADFVVSSLLAKPPTDKKSLITDISSGDGVIDENSSEMSTEEEGPSLMEQMMAAQQEARREKDKVAAEEAKAATKSFGGGFKKGFLSSAPKPVSKSAPKASRTNDSCPTAVNSQKSEIPIVRKQDTSKNSLVLDEVQEAMKNENPLLHQLRQGEWMTPDLLEKFKNNPIVLNGFKNPRCMAAFELLSKNPKEAQRKYAADEEVNTFLREFSSTMAGHFDSFGERTSSAPVSQPVAPMGPLQTKAVEKSGKMTDRTNQDASGEEARVQEILQDEELRSMLMDPELQRILQDCNDPVQFQRHMRDPATAYKIKKLFASGLVNVAN